MQDIEGPTESDSDSMVTALIKRVQCGRMSVETLFNIAENESIPDDYRSIALESIVDINLDNIFVERLEKCAASFLNTTSSELRFVCIACFIDFPRQVQGKLYPIIKELSGSDNDKSVRRAASVTAEWFDQSNR